MWKEIEDKIKSTANKLRSINYEAEKVSPQEFYDYMTGEIFSEDTTTLDDVLGNEYLMVHELVEISELKRMGRIINKKVIVGSPKMVIYEAHLKAMETELMYALYKKNYFWIKIRLRQYKESVLDNDPNLPKKLKPKAEALLEKFSKIVK